MKLGIVGLPNVGKSTLFNAITSTKNAEAANYPFCTIEPNSGIVAVPDKRLDKLAEIWQTNKKTPAIVEFVDIAGLVKGASQGAGLGNKFLGHIRECDAIVHVVRCFDDDNIIHVVEDVTKAEAVDPIADIDAIDYELILSDLEVVQNRAGRMAKAAKSGNNKGAAAEAAWLQQLADHLSAGKPARSFDFDEGDAEQQAVLHEMGLLSAKPVLYACNVGEDDLMEGIENNKYVPLVAARAKEEGARYIPICAKTEEDIADYSPEEKKAEPIDDELRTMAAALVEPVSKLIEEAQLSKALEEIFKVVSRANKYIDETAPWVLAKSEENMPRLAAVLYNLLESIRICSGLLFPFMPKTMPKVWEQIGADESMTAYDTLGTFGVLPQNVTVHKGEVLFPRIDMEKEIDELNSLLTPAKTIREDEDLDKANVITIDQFAEVKLRSGEITACEKIKKAKKLLKLTVDDGRNGRQIVSGIANWYQPEDLIGRKIVFVANLAPAKLCGELSEGMILACDAGDNDVRVLFLDKDVPNGSTIR